MDSVPLYSLGKRLQNCDIFVTLKLCSTHALTRQQVLRGGATLHKLLGTKNISLSCKGRHTGGMYACAHGGMKAFIVHFALGSG